MKREWTFGSWSPTAQFFVGVFALALVTFTFSRLGLGLATTAFVYLMVIVLLSLTGRFFVSALLSTIAVAGLNYFFAPPFFTLGADLTRDIVLVIPFFVTSLIVTGLVGRARRQTEAALQAEAKTHEAESELRLAIDAIPALVWSTLPDGSLDFINRRWAEIGLTLDDLRGSQWTGIIHPDERARVTDMWRTAVETGTAYENLERVRLRDGGYRWVLSRALPLRDELGKIIKWYGVDTDIEDRMRAEAALRRSEAYLVEAQRLSKTGSLGWNISSGEIFWSDETFRIFGYEEMPSATVDMVLQRVHPEDRALVGGTIDRASGDRKDFDLEHRLLMPDGSVKYVHVKARRVDDETGDIDFVGALSDVTSSKEAAAALQEAQAELAHATRVTTLGELTASIAHEVNQPLAGVVSSGNACLRWLASQPPNIENAKQSAERIIRDANRASEVIQRVRSLAKKAPLQKVWLDINETVLETLVLTRMEVAQHRASLSTELSDDAPLVWTDRIQLQQVILNLVMNAIEAVSAVGDGPRDLLVSTAKHEADGVLLTVRDSGTGLDPEKLDHIFDAFYTTKREGMGMGLAVSRSIIEAHGGRLWASPNEPRGAVFQFTLPSNGEEAT